MRLFGLIGYPLSHSFSKSFFTKKFEREGRKDCRYELFPLHSINELPALIKNYPELEGINVTIPYKKQVLPFLNRNKIPAGLEACNCIRSDKNGLTGFNTDITGFKASILPMLHSYHCRALVLGNGGAAEAVVFVLKELGISYEIVGRKIYKGATLTYSDINDEIIKEYKLIINTTPLGMYPHSDACPDIPYESITNLHLLFDLIYNPSKTLFLRKGEERGAVIKNGEEMLVLQAEESWSIWNS